MTLSEQILEADQRIRPYVLETPFEYAPSLSERTGAKVWVKWEHIQRTGSFKLRGAANFLLSLPTEILKRGVITASTGNHGAAVAYMAGRLDIPCTVFLPSTVSPTKLRYLQGLGVIIEMVEGDPLASELRARAVAQERGLPFISPYNDPAIIAGQGTLGVELLRQLPDMEAVFVPVGGGGLISGIAAYLKASRPSCQVIGCQPSHSPVMHESILAGNIVDVPSLPTWSDGTAGGLEPDSITYSYCRQWVDHWVRVEEDEIAHALKMLMQELYMLVEGAAGLALASLLQDPAPWKGQQVGLILCGRKMSWKNVQRLVGQPGVT